MARTGDAVKREQWRTRLERFESSGQSVTQFCRSEGVGSHAFYYWSRQLGRTSARVGPSRSPLRRGRSVQTAKSTWADKGTESTPTDVPVIQFVWNSQLSFSIPANCPEAIRCVLACASETMSRDGRDADAMPRHFAKWF